MIFFFPGRESNVGHPGEHQGRVESSKNKLSLLSKYSVATSFY